MHVQKPFYKVHCNGVKLAKKDGLFGKSDPFVVIRASDNVPFAFSEVIKDNLNPFWKPIEIDVERAGGMNGRITVSVSDHDPDGKHDLIGKFTTTVQEFVSRPGKEFQLIDDRGKKGGKFVMAKAEQELKVLPNAYEITFAAAGLPRMDGMTGKSDPFLQIYAHPAGTNKSGSPVLVAMTKFVNNCVDCTWEAITISAGQCGGHDSPIIVRCYDHDADGTHDFIGEARTTLRELVSTGPWLLLINSKKVGSMGYKNSGIVTVGRHSATQFNDTPPTTVTISVKGHKLTKKDFCGKSDPYLIIKSGEKVLHKTPVIKQNLEPVWASFPLTVAQCGNLYADLKWEVYDWDKNTKDDLIGSCKISLQRALLYQKNPVIRLVDKKLKGNMGYKNSGFLVFTSVVPNYGPAQPHAGAPGAPGGFPPQQGGYPPAAGGYPPQQGGYPPQQGGYPPAAGGYPPAAGGYPPQQGGPQRAAGGYGTQAGQPGAPQQGGYAPQQSGYAPQQGGYATGYAPQGGQPGAPQQGGYAPQQGGYAPPQGGYAPQQGGYAPQQGGYAPQQGGYAPQQGGYATGYAPQGGQPGAPQQGGYAAGGYPPQQGGYGGYPPQQGGYPPK